ncbi:MAG: type IV secretory system conjugative DNA transfer family protein, partial [Hydrogenophaga sp.]|nr:type IV secretory system conjugative DNA transfer family protein [Hydrogenophaga sp.]
SMDIGVLNHDVKLTKDQMEGPPEKLAETCIGFFDDGLEAVGEGGSIEPVVEIDEVESTPAIPPTPSDTSNTDPIRLETLEEQP